MSFLGLENLRRLSPGMSHKKYCMDTRRFQFKNATIEYDVYGTGDAVLLLHGFGVDRTLWDNFISDLSQTHRLLVPDLPGIGHSGMITEKDVSMDTYAACFAALLQHEKISTCTIIGHSMGGYITLAFADKYPEKLNAFGLFHSSAYADTEEKKETRKKAIAFTKKNGVSAFLRTSTPGMFAHPENHVSEIAAIEEKGAVMSTAALEQFYEAMMARPDRTHVLKSFANPVLFILGEHDSIVPLTQGLQQSMMPAEAHVNILTHSGHLGMLEEPAESLLKLQQFLSAVFV